MACECNHRHCQLSNNMCSVLENKLDLFVERSGNLVWDYGSCYCHKYIVYCGNNKDKKSVLDHRIWEVRRNEGY